MATPKTGFTAPTESSAGYDFQKTGYNLFVTFANAPASVTTELPFFACKSVTDAGLEGGDPIDITTNATVGAREQAPADLASPTEISFTAAYNLEDRALVAGMLNIPMDVIVEYRKCGNRPFGQKITYSGAALTGYVPGDMTEGEAPEVTITITLAGGTHYAVGEGESWSAAGVLEAL